jgi:hypothetical protein
MNRLDSSEGIAALEQLVGHPWQKVLAVFVPVRLATMSQIVAATGLSLRQARKVVRYLQEIRGQYGDKNRPAEGAIALLPSQRVYPGRPGKHPAVYRLTPLGARLLQEVGYQDARPCGLHDEQAIAHAVCTLDIRLAAQEAGLAVQTERKLGPLRPDNLVTLRDGRRMIYETEQRATPHLLKRIMAKLERLDRFFASAPADLASEVHLIFNVARSEWPRTRRVWQQALTAVAEEAGRPLRFTLRAWSLTAFLEEPCWGEAEGGERWVPQLQREAAPPRPGKQGSAEMITWPAEWDWDPVTDSDTVLVRAYQRLFEAEMQDRAVRPALHFLHLVQVIYASSHATDDPVAQVAVPHVSLWQLRQWLESHPRLRKDLIRGLREVRRARSSGVRLLQDRMTALIWDVFLRHQGFAPGTPLQVRVAMPQSGSWESRLHVEVSIAPALLFALEEVVVQEEVQRAEAALKWVLEALFCYSRELGLEERQKKGRKKGS